MSGYANVPAAWIIGFSHNLNTWEVLVTLYRLNADGTRSLVPFDPISNRLTLLDANTIRINVLLPGEYVWTVIGR